MIPYFDATAAYRAQQGEIDAAITGVLTSGRLVLGPQVEAFEQEFAGYVGTRHAVGVASGTDAISLALRALGIGAGDEVITVANAGVATVAAIRAASATPRFVDVEASSLLMDPAQLAAALTPRTRAVLPVHLYGRPARLDAIVAFASAHRLAVIEDCAQAHGATWQGRHVGGFGHIGCFSFYPTKNLGAFGDGGMCVTNADELAERLRMLRSYGFRGDQEAHCEGINSRLDEIQAAILRVKLRHLPAALAARRALAEAYDGELAAAIRRPQDDPNGRSAFHIYAVLLAQRAAAVAELDRNQIGWRIHYAPATHLCAAYASLGYRRGDLPVTERTAHDVLSLPLYPELPHADVVRVAEVLRRAVQGGAPDTLHSA